ncbi:hypothetical protein NIES4102_35810 [Chondrocystis sp. NIES-4102]|nr:hypothetical protein NIES4102_35810 [Chondrocystis sp. NIES-4102]
MKGISIIIILGLIYLLWLQAKQKKPKYKNKLGDSLEKQLLRMLHGDQKAAFRLLRSVKKNYPGKTYRWYYEKVIYDIEKDRRY